jgi:hypothetical protein
MVKMDFEGDAFISYAHLDNVALVEGRKGWVENLQRALEIRVAQRLGKDSQIWWDPELQGNDYFEMTLMHRLRRVAALVAVVSPRYVKSEWGRRELAEFCRAAEEQGGVRIGDKARIFKVLKTPVPFEEHPPELQNMLGYEFFKIDSKTGKVRELDEVFGEEAQKEFWIRLDDLVHDMCQLLKAIDVDALPTGETVYLAVTTSDLKESREAIRRGLQQQGIKVLPDRPLPLSASEVEEMVREDLARSVMSIHMVGQIYSLVPEGGVASVIEMQNRLALERAAAAGFSHLIWIPPGLEVRDDRQRELVECMRTDPRCSQGTDILETTLQDLRTVIDARLAQSRAAAQKRLGAPPRRAHAGHLYLLYDRRDDEAVRPWSDFLFQENLEVISPEFVGDEAEIREAHEEYLRICDGVLIFHRSANETWLRRKMREIQKIAGYGRSKPAPLVGICLVGPRTPDKERFRTHEAVVIPQWDGLSAADLQRFLAEVKAAVKSRDNEGADTSG